MKKRNFHTKPEEILLENSDATVVALRENSAVVERLVTVVSQLHQAVSDKSVEIDGFLGTIKSLKNTRSSLDELKDYIDHPEKVVRKLEEVRSAFLVTNRLLEGISKKPNIDVEIEGAKITTIRGEKGDKGERGERGERGVKGDAGIQGLKGERGLRGPEGRQGPRGIPGTPGKDGKPGRSGEDGKRGKDGSPDTPDEIVEKVNKSKKKIQASKIEGLKKLIDTATGDTMNQVGYGGGGGINGLRVKDLSSLTDGVTKQFSVPSTSMPLMVIGSDFPTALFRDNGFTLVGETLILTTVNAPSAGSQLGFLYAF